MDEFKEALRQHWMKILAGLAVLIALVIGYFMSSNDDGNKKSEAPSSPTLNAQTSQSGQNPSTDASSVNTQGVNQTNEGLSNVSTSQLSDGIKKLATQWNNELGQKKNGSQIDSDMHGNQSFDPFFKAYLDHAQAQDFPAKAATVNASVDSGTGVNQIVKVTAQDNQGNTVYTLGVEPFYKGSDFQVRIVEIDVPQSGSTDAPIGATMPTSQSAAQAADGGLLSSAERVQQLQEATQFTKTFVNTNKAQESADQHKARLVQTWGFNPPAFLKDNIADDGTVVMYTPNSVSYLNSPYSEGKNGDMLIGVESGWSALSNTSQEVGTFVATIQYKWDNTLAAPKESGFSIQDTSAN